MSHVLKKTVSQNIDRDQPAGFIVQTFAADLAWSVQLKRQSFGSPEPKAHKWSL